MNEDEFVASVDDVQRAAAAVSESLRTYVEVLQWARKERIAGRALVEVVDGLVDRGGTAARRQTSVALRDYERAIAHGRSVVVRALVDEYGLNFTQVSRQMAVSRQMVARLYRRFADEQPSAEVS